MALTTNHANNEIIKFRRNVATDFLRASRLDPFMGADSTNPSSACRTWPATARKSAFRWLPS
jgi:hypothetical protein